MTGLLAFLVGAAGGFLAHSLAMNISFKQRMIDRKVRVYDSLIGKWIQMRNYIYKHHPGQPVENYPAEIIQQFDQLYGESQQLIAEAMLACEDGQLTDDINSLNERLCHTEWHKLHLAEANMAMEAIRVEAFRLVSRMRDDIKSGTRLELQDLTHILSGFRRNKYEDIDAPD